MILNLYFGHRPHSLLKRFKALRKSHLCNILHTSQGIHKFLGGRGFGRGTRPWSPSPDARCTVIVNRAPSTSPETAWDPGSGTGSPSRRVPARALAVRHSAATRLPARGSSSARPTSPVNSNSPSGRTPAPSAASASPSAAHHFLRGSVWRPGRAPLTLGQRTDLGTRGLHRAFLRFLGRGCEEADITGAPRGGRRGCGGPPLRDSGLPEEAPGSPAVRLGPGRSSGRRRRTRLPAPTRPTESREEAGKRSPVAAEHLPIHGPHGGAHSAETDGPTANGGRRQRQQGGSEYRQAVLLRSSGRSKVEREWKAGAETRDAPATAVPPPSPPPRARPRLASPRPSASTPSLGPAHSRPPARLQGALFLRHPETPPPGAPPRRARPAPASLLRSRERAPCASRFAAPPALPRAPPAFRLLRPGRPSLDTSPLPAGKALGTRLRRVGRSVPRGPQNRHGIAPGGQGCWRLGPEQGGPARAVVFGAPGLAAPGSASHPPGDPHRLDRCGWDEDERGERDCPELENICIFIQF